MTCRHGVGDQVPPLRVDQDRGHDEPAGDAADHAVADLLEHQRRRAAPVRDLRLFDISGRDRRERGRDADAVVEPALDVETLADAAQGRASSVTTAWPARRPSGTRITPRITASSMLGLAEEDGRRDAPRRSSAAARSRAAAAARRGRLASARRSITATRSQNSTSASVASAQRPHRRARAVEVDLADLGPHQQPEQHEDHRRRDQRPRTASRNHAAATSSRLSATMASDHSMAGGKHRSLPPRADHPHGMRHRGRPIANMTRRCPRRSHGSGPPPALRRPRVLGARCRDRLPGAVLADPVHRAAGGAAGRASPPARAPTWSTG